MDIRLHPEVHAKLKVSVAAKTVAAAEEEAEEGEGKKPRARRSARKETAESAEG